MLVFRTEDAQSLSGEALRRLAGVDWRVSNKGKMKNILNKKLIYEVLSVVIARVGLLPVFWNKGRSFFPKVWNARKPAM